MAAASDLSDPTATPSSLSTPSSPHRLPYITLPGTSISVSKLALGTWQFGDPTSTYKKQSAEAEAAIVRAAFDAGINFFDTAEAYNAGESERSLGAAIRAAGIPREAVVIASKVHSPNLEYAKVKEACARSLANLGFDYIDLYQIHWPNHAVPLAETMRAFRELFDEGKIRAVGVSNFGPLDLAEARATGIPIATVQLPYSPVWRAIELECVPACLATDPPMGVLAYSPIAQGLLSGKYAATEDCSPGLTRSRLFDKARSPLSRHTEDGCEAELWAAVREIGAIAGELGVSMPHVAIAWTLAQPGVLGALFGVSDPSQIAENIRAAAEPLPTEVLARITAVTEPIKAKIGRNPDLWDSADGGRYR